tara:strand:- start:5091 stop:6206 length:1116 start_codon:yes stop_codon:yes gene_type:complete
MDKFIPVNEPSIGKREKELVNECLDTGWISSEGPFVEKFEISLSKRINRKYGIACSSGTAALDIAVASLRIGNGDEVIMPTFTIISCAAAIIKSGAKPILVDSDPNTWNMDVNAIEDAITSRTVAIMAVHIYGLPVDMDPLIKIANKYGLYVIEDAAELIGATYKNKSCGSFGHISTFSFYPNKQITTGEGGMIFTDDIEISNRCKSLRNLCFQPECRFIHNELGWNYRMTNLQAALGLAQLEKLDLTLRKKIKIGEIYNKNLQKVNNLVLPLKETNFATNIYWVFGLLIDRKIGTAKEFMEKLKKLKIGTRPFFYPMHKQPIFEEMGIFEKKDFPISENLYQQGFYLPSGINLTEEDINTVSKKFKKIYK